MTQTAVQPAPRARNGPDGLPHRATRRVAVYVRVSTDEQAALEFNSLQAQEQICRTYVSMRSDDPAAKERWVATETYCDPGYSGGTLERPALKRLLADVEAGRVDTLIVYKIDRLSRSIHQFYRIWEVLERHGVDLISATQDLNTTTSQGKLMLNMLLSFGQFEREQIGERTRDKVAAARRRGKWTGGTPVLGYDVRDGRLVVNEEEAARVREIFRLYEEHRSLTRVVEDVSHRGWTGKERADSGGKPRAGRPLDKPTVYRLLANPLYAGLIRCGTSLVRGEHDAIVPLEAWRRVQTHLRRNGSAGYQGERESSDALLRGLLRCGACGLRMTPTYAVKGRRRYRYYVCQTIAKKGAHACPTGRVAAAEVERQVIEQIRAIARDPALMVETAHQARHQRDELVERLKAEARDLRRELRGKMATARQLATVVARGGEAGQGAARQLAEVQTRARAIKARLAELPGQIGAGKRAAFNAADIRAALEAFGPVWDALFPAERARVIAALIGEVAYRGRDGTLAITLRRSLPIGTAASPSV